MLGRRRGKRISNGCFDAGTSGHSSGFNHRLCGSVRSETAFPISRNIGRDAIGDHDFIGTDIWRMYEFSWLNANGLPQAAEVDLFVPASSPSIIESKSLKLYQGSFAQTRFAGGAEEVAAILKRDLSNAAGAPVEVAVNTLDTWTPTIDDLPGELLEEAFPDVSITDFEVNPELLEKAPAAIDTDVKDNIRAAVWRTNLFVRSAPSPGSPTTHRSL